MRFRVTGGADGVSGIEVANKRYEAGQEVELTAKQAEWLLEQGYLESPDAPKKVAKPAESAPAPEPEAPAEVADDASDDAGSEF